MLYLGLCDKQRAGSWLEGRGSSSEREFSTKPWQWLKGAYRLVQAVGRWDIFLFGVETRASIAERENGTEEREEKKGEKRR